MSAVAQESLSGVRVVRAYRQEAAELDRFRRANEEYVRRNRRLIALQGFFFPSMAFFLGLGAMLVLWQGSRQVILGRITIGQFVAFNAYLTMLAWPMIAFGWVTNMVQRGMASWKRMLDILDQVPAIRDEVSAPEASAASAFGGPVHGDVEFRDLSLSYGDVPVLQHVSARVPAGQTVALVGPTGSGKSTLISLLARLQDPPPGTVFIDGRDVRRSRWPSSGARSVSSSRSRFCSPTPSRRTLRLESTVGQAGQIGQVGRARRAGRAIPTT